MTLDSIGEDLAIAPLLGKELTYFLGRDLPKGTHETTAETKSEAECAFARARAKSVARFVVETRAIAVPVDVAETGGITVQLELVKCGKADCKRCRRRPTHGPYWYAYVWSKRKQGLVSRYIGKNLELLRSRSWYVAGAGGIREAG